MQEQQPDFTQLIPELQEWNEGTGIDVDSWIASVGSYEHAIAYTHLFWPQFVEYDGCVFSDEAFSIAGYHNWMKGRKIDRRFVEERMNHLHLSDLFPSEPTIPQMLYLGHMFADMWRTKLQRDFPDKRFTVEVREGNEYWFEGYEVTFFQTTHAPPQWCSVLPAWHTRPRRRGRHLRARSSPSRR